MRSHAITKLLSDPSVSDQVYTEIVGHVGNAMKRRYSKQRMEKKRGAMDAMCRTQIDLCEQQAESEATARKQQAESEVRTSLGLPEKKMPEHPEQTSTPQGRIPSIGYPSIQASRSRTPGRFLRRRLIRRRRLDNIATPVLHPSAPNVVSFPGPKRA
jgi:hypothetical protein